MLEIQNMGEAAIDLQGNQMGTARIYVGEQVYRELVAGDASVSGKSASLVGDYDGAHVFWARDVCSAAEAYCARLYKPRQEEEVAMMSMSPEMVDY